MASVRFSGQILKLSRVKDAESLNTRTARLLERSVDDQDSRAATLKTACKAACRLGLWSDCLRFASDANQSDAAILASTGLALVRSGASDDSLASKDTLIASLIPVEDIDTDELLAGPLPSRPRLLKQPSKNKKRKLTKQYPVGSQPDPERWLPKAERTKQTRKPKKGPIVGSQGAAVVGGHFVTAGPSTAQVQVPKPKQRKGKK